MTGILMDNDVQGHVTLLLGILQGAEWRDLWQRVNRPLFTFEDFQLPREATDVVVWRTCQQHQVILITGNRNDDGPDSLEATIRDFNRPDCLPVLTLANPFRIRSSKQYAARVAEKLLEYLLDIEQYRGAGRLYLP